MDQDALDFARRRSGLTEAEATLLLAQVGPNVTVPIGTVFRIIAETLREADIPTLKSPMCSQWPRFPRRSTRWIHGCRDPPRAAAFIRHHFGSLTLAYAYSSAGVILFFDARRFVFWSIFAATT